MAWQSILMKEALARAIKHCAPDFSMDEAISAREQRGHVCKQTAQWCSDDMLDRINAQYSESLHVGGPYPDIRFQFSI